MAASTRDSRKKAAFGLAYKITTLVIVLVAVIMGTVSYFSIVQEAKLKTLEMDKRMTDVANMVAALKLIEPLAGESVAWPVFREFIKVIRNLDPNILYISIVTNDGEVQAFTLNPESVRSLDSNLALDESLESLNKLTAAKFPGGNTAKIAGDIVVENSRFATVNIRFSLLALKRDIMWAEVRNLLLTFLMMVLGFFGAVWLAKNVTRPIEDLTKAMSRVAKGDLGVSAQVVSKDEIGLLTESFNLMVQDLREKVRIKDAFDVVADELKEVNKIKEAFQIYITKEAQERFIDSNALAQQSAEGTRQPVTLLFADLTQLAQNATSQEAASLSEALDHYFRKYMSTIFEYEGQVYKFTENLFIVVFGMPTAHSDDERRAILTAVNMQKALAEINKGRVARSETPLYISSAVAKGEAYGSLLTAKGMTSLEVIRDYLGFTQKMSAQPLSVLMVAGDVFRSVTNLVRGEKVEDLQMPDSGDMLEVYRITGAKF
ncbi:MAG: HAMP domain-containing protein [Candidatus Firestonebacteria bacterium]|nr:HAMP domain-containing protein [Candidatus Firestonebacteria bacterium]